MRSTHTAQLAQHSTAQHSTAQRTQHLLGLLDTADEGAAHGQALCVGRGWGVDAGLSGWIVRMMAGGRAGPDGNAGRHAAHDSQHAICRRRASTVQLTPHTDQEHKAEGGQCLATHS